MASKDLQDAHSSAVPSAASMKGKGIRIITEPTTPPNKNTFAVTMLESASTYTSLAKLTFGTACTVRVMVCRKWESTDLKGNPISTDYIISDEQGGAIHCTAWKGLSHRLTKALEEGNCCTIKGSVESMEFRCKAEPRTKRQKLSICPSPSEQTGDLQGDSNTTSIEDDIIDKSGALNPPKRRLFATDDEY